MMDIKVIITKVIYQESKGQDNYGNATYTAYKERYAYQNATGRDNYGNPTYNNWYMLSYIRTLSI